MKPITAVIVNGPHPFSERLYIDLTASALVERVLVVQREQPGSLAANPYESIAGSLFASATIDRILERVSTEYLLVFSGDRPLSLNATAAEAMLEAARSNGAGMVYGDFYEESGHNNAYHPLNGYQMGSVRDTFDFGPVQLFSIEAARMGRKAYAPSIPVHFAGLYDLRLRASLDHVIHHLQEPLCCLHQDGTERESMFAYVDPKNVSVQKEMEAIFTDYLKGIGAYLPSRLLGTCDRSLDVFPVEASVIIPVRNRMGTIKEAVESALSQETDFAFNVIVVDNHSTDGTTEILSDMAAKHARLRVIVPLRTDLGIGGCWNDALYSTACGRYSVQLDSDDLYATTGTLQKIIDLLRDGRFAMVIGAYTLVDQNLTVIEPGLVDHWEWSDENGHNNALRVNGLGAPRAFDTRLMRETGFLNVSYGEDYAAALHISGQYRIGRIYESIYLCRRWSGNTDAALSIEETNRNDAFKDRIRTQEIMARQQMNRERGERP